MRFTSKLIGLTMFAAALLPLATAARAQESNGRVVLILPFDNRSGNPSLNWIGDSFPDTLDARLDSAGFLTISQDDRTFALDHLGLPTGFRPSRATTIKIAQQLDADYVIVGSYNVSGDAITIQAQVLNIHALHMTSPLESGTPLANLFDAENSIAWKIARQIDPHFSVAEQTFLKASGEVPLSSFENYIRGTNASTSAERLHRLISAVNDTPTYSAALLALGKEQYAAHDYAAAAKTLARVPATDRHGLEARFYLGLSQFNSTDYVAAAAAFASIATRLPLPEVVNDQAVSEARQSHNAVALFRQASSEDPSDEDYHYNLASALYRAGDLPAAAAEVDIALKLKPEDHEAQEFRAHLRQPGAVAFTPVERVRRTYSEAGFRQAAFQIDQLRAARTAVLSPDKQAAESSAAGRDYLSRGLVPEAEQEFDNALRADPNSAAAHAGLAEVREASANPNDARSEALLSIRLQPNAEAYLVLARLDAAQNLYAAAMEDVSQALQVEPSSEAAMTERQALTQHMNDSMHSSQSSPSPSPR